jgi:flavodoxin
MKILVTCYSETGNTLKVARAIYGEIEGEKALVPLAELESLDGYDLIFFGFPIMQFGVPRKVRSFLKAHAAGRKVALFVTHASWEAPGQTEMLAGWLEKCKTAAEGARLAGFFHCRGELSADAAARFMESDIPEIRHFGSMQPATVGHPDAVELEEAGAFARRVVSELTSEQVNK